MTEVIEYYYDYVEYEYYDDINLLGVNQTVNYHRTRREVKVNPADKLNISTTKFLTHNRLNKNEFEFTLQVAFKIFNLDMSKFSNGNKFILCNLKPCAGCECSNETIEYDKTKAKEYFKSSPKRFYKNLLVANIDSNGVNPLSLAKITPDFKCSNKLEPSSKMTAMNFLQWIKLDVYSYIILCLNIVSLVTMILLLKFVIFKKGMCSKCVLMIFRGGQGFNNLVIITEFFGFF